MIDPLDSDEPEYPDDDEPDQGRTHTLHLTHIPDAATITTTELVRGSTMQIIVTIRDAFPIDPTPFGAGVESEKFDAESPIRARFDPRNRLN